MIWFWSDPHFYHRAIIRLCDRPFPSIEAMHATLVDNYAERVVEGDAVYWLGDCCLGGRDRLRAILDDLPGRKVLVRGNHDRGPGAMAAAGFDLVVESATMWIAGHPVELSHFPYKSGRRDGDVRAFPFPERRQGWALLHGHTHSKRRRDGTMIHVGVDAWGYRPVAMSEVEALVEEAFA